MTLEVIILAAGEGTRMRSTLPKVLHPLAGRPLLAHVVAAAHGLDADDIVVVYGHGGERVREQLKGLDVKWIEQAEQLGTGHAVAQAMPLINTQSTVLVLYGDVPLITAATLQALVGSVTENSIALLTAQLENPYGYGRIIRNDAGEVTRIVEEKDASDAQRAINEINTGIVAAPGAQLAKWLDALDNNNVQREYYLTDIIEKAVSDRYAINTVQPASLDEIKGVNNRLQLAELERSYQRKQAESLMLGGVTLHDPSRFDLRGELTAGKDVIIDVNVIIEGKVILGDRVHIGPHSTLRDCVIANDAIINANCVIEQAQIGNHCRIGPFARIRPETQLADEVHIGNFVEIKKSTVRERSKINHLSYIGDSTIGRDVNIGAGTITCNYDGANKYRTEIGDNVFVGSDSQLVAPIKIGAGATIGAGSTITKDVPAGDLTLSRAPQQTRSGWKRPQKKEP